MKYCWDYLYELGFTEEEMSAYENEGWADGTLETLSDPDLADTYRANVKLMLEYYDRDEVLRLMTRYTDAFMIGEETFRRRMCRIQQKLGNDWDRRIWEQYCEDEDDAALEGVGYLSEADWEAHLAGLQ